MGRVVFDRLKSDGWSGVKELISERAPETLHLEFKSKGHGGEPGKIGDEDKKNLAKSISAFANTEGGCLIFGISTDQGKGSDADRAKAVQLIDDLGGVKRSVEAILRDVVNPAIPGVELHVVEDSAGSDRGILALYIPQSVGRPHRANMGSGDVREHYYQRTASRSDIMPHSILAALMGRVPSASLYLLLNIWIEQPSVLRFWLELGNSGRGSARQPAIKLFESEPALRSLWYEAVSSTQLSSDWRIKRSFAPGADEGSVLLSSDPDTVVYPGDRLLLTENGPGTIPGRWAWGRGVDLPAKGVLYSLEAAPVEFDDRVSSAAVRDARIAFFFPRQNRG
jgi:hypothetical protein